jgi:hypothetical protein
MYYSRKRSRAWCVGVLATTLVCYAALQVGIVFALRVSFHHPTRVVRKVADAAVKPSYRRGTSGAKAGVRFLGILSSALLSCEFVCPAAAGAYRSNCGCRPQYYEIYRLRAVVGISLTFMAVDLLGGLFSILSLVFKSRFDAIAGVAYSLVVVRLFYIDTPLSIPTCCRWNN